MENSQPPAVSSQPPAANRQGAMTPRKGLWGHRTATTLPPTPSSPLGIMTPWPFLRGDPEPNRRPTNRRIDSSPLRGRRQNVAPSVRAFAAQNKQRGPWRHGALAVPPYPRGESPTARAHRRTRSHPGDLNPRPAVYEFRTKGAHRLQMKGFRRIRAPSVTRRHPAETRQRGPLQTNPRTFPRPRDERL